MAKRGEPSMHFIAIGGGQTPRPYRGLYASRSASGGARGPVLSIIEEGRKKPYYSTDRRDRRRLTVPEAAAVLGVVLEDEAPHVEAMKARAERLGVDAVPEGVEDLTKRHVTIPAMWVGEDEIIRGERERPGPLVKWNEDGTVCE